MFPDSGAWEEEYTQRGMLWGGGTHVLPDLPLSSRVLELGCGNGKTLFAMIQRGWNVIAIDFSSRAVTLSREILGGASYGHVMIADARFPPFKHGTFDAVFALHVIGHMRETDRHYIANTLQHILRPGGILFFSDFSTHDFRFGKGDVTETGTYRRGPGYSYPLLYRGGSHRSFFKTYSFINQRASVADAGFGKYFDTIRNRGNLLKKRMQVRERFSRKCRTLVTRCSGIFENA